MQNKIEITDDFLIVTPQGINKLASFKDKIEIPLKNVFGASIDNEILDEYKGLRGPGTSLPGYWAGTFTKNNEKVFFNIKRGNKPVVIQLKNEKFVRLILGVDHPEKVVDSINEVAQNI
ncbi:hypothetical protein R4B61_01860 [Fructilactobacillus vespulae]|uniref:PH domain-containing protein n=1 Tax=Fructilactobacillus vespulae TaxID=1249630 RepID=UPI0039B4B1A9